MEILINPPVAMDEVIQVIRAAGLRRPVDDVDRMTRMFQSSNLVLTARKGDQLVGVCRALTDFSYACYVSDLAVRLDWQHHGVGAALLARLAAHLGDQVSLVLLSAPEATGFYPKVGFENVDNCFLRRRAR
ncbi:MAG: GNAT family N-acetyltransferase [Rhodocyclaceae bacterium]|nr:MAG: GNAT family N-acetyltransferase [Rhodocyclaceae bacterium]